MSWDEAQQHYWATIENHLRALHGPDLFESWSANPDEFVKDMLSFCQASYRAGYNDALWEAQRRLHRMEMDE